MMHALSVLCAVAGFFGFIYYLSTTHYIILLGTVKQEHVIHKYFSYFCRCIKRHTVELLLQSILQVMLQ